MSRHLRVPRKRPHKSVLSAAVINTAEWLEPRRLLSSAPVGPEIPIAASSGGTSLTGPAVAIDNAGDFIVTWSASGGGSNGLDIWARRYDAAGDPLGDAFVANTTTAGDQVAPAIATDAGGDFVISWATIFGNPSNELWTLSSQSFDSTGAARGGQVTLSNSGWLQPGAKVTMFSDASFVAAWQTKIPGNTNEVVYQDYSSSGVPSGSQIVVTSLTASIVVGVVNDASGDIAVAWLNANTAFHLSAYNGTGTALSGDVLVASANIITDAGVAMTSTGNIGVTWLSSSSSSVYQCFANGFSLGGVAQGAN
ncbi:MAG TPA: hypothetical protein VLI90_18430, partial [Tepidisphaeraceae bacterium]|nr:hypothetical protein [Tepidisphaeraceae bacterium]